MPAPKGIPTPEAGAVRLDERIGDSRTTLGWISNDDELVATHEGKVLLAIDPSEMQWDERTGMMTISLNQMDGHRLLRWMRHCAEHLEQDTSGFILDLERGT